MKLKLLLEALSRVPQKPKPVVDKDDIMSGYRDTALDVVFHILGDNIADEDDDGPGKIYVSKSWTGYDLFSEMDSDPGMGGAIGLVDPNGTSAKAIATAAHESFHALLQLRSKNFANEHVVNRLATRWLQNRYDGPFLHAALEVILSSKISYRGRKFEPTKEWLKNHQLTKR